MTDTVKERWQNMIMYISASIEQQESANSRQEAEDINKEMYDWLTSTYTLSVKKKKPTITIFDLMKKPKTNQP